MLPSTLHTLALLVLASFTVAKPSKHYKLVKGIDNSHYVSEKIYRKAYKQGFHKLVVRGWEEAWSLKYGGQPDPNFLSNVINAYKAGYRDIDAIWFPCSGRSHNCKSYEQQALEFKEYNKKYRIPIKRVWLALEIDKQASNWDYGRDSTKEESNYAEAKKMVKAIRTIDKHAGIYSNPGHWYNMFGAFDVDVASNMTLWWFDWDGKKSFEDLHPHPKFGGWEIAHAKQYTNISASGLFNLNVFLVPAN